MIVLCWFLHHNDYNGFRLEELEALASLEGIESASLWKDCTRPQSHSEDQFVFVNIPSEDFCAKAMHRSLLIRAFVEVWAEGTTYDEVLQKLKTSKMDEFRNWVNDHRTWAFKVGAFGKTLSSDDQRAKMNFFSMLFKGTEKVNLENPDTTLIVAEICHKSKHHPFWWRYRLSVRPILGPTSLDCELAFLMCNQGLVGPNHLVLDPFVGTGSLLVAAAHYGACCFGSDIDIRVLKGYGVSYLNPRLSLENKNTDIFRNFDDYGLRRPEIIRCDNAAWVWRLPYEDRATTDQGMADEEQTCSAPRKAAYLGRNIEGGKPWVDCIMTDPPYVVYNSRAVISDLLNLSARLLVDGGRLVFLMPVELSSAQNDVGLLCHEDLVLVSASLQELSAGMGRVLITLSRKARRQLAASTTSTSH